MTPQIREAAEEAYGIDQAVRDICSVSVTAAPKSRVKDIILKLMSEVHETEQGYCCACGYDIAGFETAIALAERRGGERVVKAVEESKEGVAGEIDFEQMYYHCVEAARAALDEMGK